MTTSVLGAGFSPFGISPAGFGSPATTNPINKTIFIDYFGNKGQTRLIDPITQDYVFNSNGRIVGGNGIQQLVYLALVTVLGSSAVTTLGQDFTSIKTLGTNYPSIIKGKAQQALQSLIDAKKIQLIDVIVNISGTNRSTIDIKWKDLATGTELTNTF